MNEQVTKAMKRINRKLTKWEYLSATSCGFDELVAEAAKARIEAEKEISKELERLRVLIEAKR